MNPRMPRLTTLMEECWAQDPSDRRSATDILHDMQDASFSGLISIVQSSEAGLGADQGAELAPGEELGAGLAGLNTLATVQCVCPSLTQVME